MDWIDKEKNKQSSYDSSEKKATVKKETRGRPTKKVKRDKKITMNFTDEEYERICEYCERNERKVAEYCREVVNKLLKRKTFKDGE